MACFVVPAAEAIVVTAVYLAAKRREQKIEAPKLADGNKFEESTNKITWSKRLSWLMGLLWGGVVLLAFEHFWHGEVVPFPPFLSAMATPEDKAEMLHEMGTVGVGMAVNVTVIWGIVCAVVQAKYNQIKKAIKKEA